MSLSEISFSTTVKRLYFYKLKANVGIFSSLVLLQIMAILFSLNGTGQMGTGGMGFSVSVNYYSANLVIGFTMLWAFIQSIMLTTKSFRYDDFTFVTNRVTSNIANIAFLVTVSFVGAVLALLTSPLLKVVAYYFLNHEVLLETSAFYSPTEFMIGVGATSLYVLLFSALGYLVGTFVQISKIFSVILPAVFFATLFLEAREGAGNLLASIISALFTESSFALFFIKVGGSVLLFFFLATIMSNRLEVKQ
ncbi:hypothetical protein JCM9140_936 [Halalkalibacter wakoensis JCM 9140]|uniref:Uncharacterized protein n=1 Tax=Halalkalibacter wakoensis JCM 9140 TaxID=1236970 RepID=W4Q0S9_9BACI|nr:hypothetical protein [Halalkalibacter wakoensis]GAE24969.1 hypothetical protein JCM9140_936 [Halalkalibacter wakoensis JCM 9140]